MAKLNFLNVGGLKANKEKKGKHTASITLFIEDLYKALDIHENNNSESKTITFLLYKPQKEGSKIERTVTYLYKSGEGSKPVKEEKSNYTVNEPKEDESDPFGGEF